MNDNPAATERAATIFADRFDSAPTGVWAAPGRVNLIGEHTDYNDGYVLPFAIPRRTAVAASTVDRPEWTVYSETTDEMITIETPRPGTPDGWGAYVAAVIWVLREAGHDVPGARLAIASDVPLGAGLSSSAALECSVLDALVDLGGLRVPVADRPRLAQRAENAYVGMPSGVMDQAAVTLCREGHALFLDCRSLATDHVPFALGGDAPVEILVIDTRAPHRLVDGEYAARRATCEAAAKALGVAALRDIEPEGLAEALRRLDGDETRRRVRHVVTENQRVLDTVDALRAGDTAAVGRLMTASHASMRDDYEITVAEVDVAVAAALTAGAYGARMTGGGFGGCVLALVDAARSGEIGTAVRRAFAERGFTEPTTFVAPPSGGATRVA